jgi:hypothetical protein
MNAIARHATARAATREPSTPYRDRLYGSEAAASWPAWVSRAVRGVSPVYSASPRLTRWSMFSATSRWSSGEFSRDPAHCPLRAAAIRDDQPPPLGQPAQEGGVRRALPLKVDVRGSTRQEQQVDATVTDNLVGERELVVPGVAHRSRHCDAVSHPPWASRPCSAISRRAVGRPGTA